jgi:hypothetical protein
MTTTQRRIALLTGASLATLGLATPALAAPHNDVPPGTYSGTSTNTDIIPICEIADGAPDDCFFGVVAEGTPSVLAVVNSTANGQIRQADGFTSLVDLTIANIATEGYSTNAEVGAVAIVTGAPAFGSADARLGSAIQQSGFSAGAIHLEFDNAGSFLIDAHAYASGTTGADASARIRDYGLEQLANFAGYATMLVANTGDLTISGYATASASEGRARARALTVSGDLPLPAGIVQTGGEIGNGVRGDAYGTLNMDVANGAGDTLTIDMRAMAHGDTATAHADLDNGIVQYGHDADQLHMGVANAGLLNIGATA